MHIQASVTTAHNSDSNEYIGFLDRTTACALYKVLEKHDVDLRASLSYAPSPNTKESAVKWGASLPIDIFAYGHEHDFDVIGSEFSDRDIYLQHPRYQEHLLFYKNPQYLVRPGHDYPTLDWRQTEKSDTSDEVSSEQLDLDENQLDRIFETARGPEIYSGVEQSQRLHSLLQR